MSGIVRAMPIPALPGSMIDADARSRGVSWSEFPSDQDALFTRRLIDRFDHPVRGEGFKSIPGSGLRMGAAILITRLLIVLGARGKLIRDALSLGLARLARETGPTASLGASQPLLRNEMKRSARGLWAGPWVGALIALLTSGSVWPQSAQAGCSEHYVRYSKQTDRQTFGLDFLSLAESAPTHPLEIPGERPPPCSGALCSGNPATPTPTPPLVHPSWSEHGALPSFPSHVTGFGSFARAFLSDQPWTIDYACSIFRPPRGFFSF